MEIKITQGNLSCTGELQPSTVSRVRGKLVPISRGKLKYGVELWNYGDTV